LRTSVTHKIAISSVVSKCDDFKFSTFSKPLYYELLLHSGEEKFDKFTPYDNRHYRQVTLKYRQYIPPKRYLCTRLHDFTVQISLVSAPLKLTDTA